MQENATKLTFVKALDLHRKVDCIADVAPELPAALHRNVDSLLLGFLVV